MRTCFARPSFPPRFERDLDRQAEQYAASRHTCKSPANKEVKDATDNLVAAPSTSNKKMLVILKGNKI
nr:AIF_HP1_G0030820.mRNA.1.CDS.1 [Saccharomyces cerevisiae]